MYIRRRRIFGQQYARLLLLLATTVGCSSSGSPSVEFAAVNPTAAAEQALKLYDKDADGILNDAELAACPGLEAARDRYDKNGDRQVSKDEIAARLESLFSTGVGLTSVSCQVYRGSQPLSGATVWFVPYPFLESALKPAYGTTDASGVANISIPAEEQSGGPHLSGIYPGVYRVEIMHPSMKTLHDPIGCEVDPTNRGSNPVFRL